MRDEHPPHSDPSTRPVEREDATQERGALIVSILAVVVILVVGSPCICYFGIGLFQGIHTLQTGQQHNPARQTLRKKQYERDSKYDRTFQKPSERESPPSSP